MNKTKKFIVDLENYSIIKKINSGSYGTVYSVQNTTTDEYFAAKVINAARTSRLNINREIGIISRIRHPTIVKFYGYSLTDFEDYENPTLILQLSQKGSLADLIKKSRKSHDVDFNNTIRQKILIGIARGMMHLHKHNIIHRDLKPGNVLLDDNYEPLITDFGSSKVIENQPNDQTASVGTTLYMAPEVIDGGTYNGKADVFSFGILMYEVVTAKVPYAELLANKVTTYQLSRKVVDENRRPKFTVEVKQSIRDLIKKCWSADALERPSFEEIYNRLAFNEEESICDIFQDDDDEGKYYLPGVDENEILEYTLRIDVENESENDNEVVKLKERLDKLEKENKQMANRIKKLEKENQIIKQQLETAGSSPSTPQFVKKGNKIEVNFNSNDKFNGILNYLKNNSHDFTTDVEITLSSVPRSSKNLSIMNVTNANDIHSDISTKDEINSWIRIEFKKVFVVPSYYIIRTTYTGINGSHPKSWKIEGSLDSIDWDILDTQEDCEHLNGRNLSHCFPIECSHKYKFIRMRQTDCNCYGHNVLSINFIEFFGKIIHN